MITKNNNRIIVTIMNSKGGAGKTTIATNLAASFTMMDQKTVLVDHDKQGSATKWLQKRPRELKEINGVYVNDTRFTRGLNKIWQLEIPDESDIVIVDTPAGFDGFELDDLVKKTNIIIIPVLPSAHDIRATAEFIGNTLLLNYSYRNKKPAVCVIANRIDKSSLAFIKLEKFLHSLNIPFISKFSDSRYYLQAAEKGVGFCEVATKINREEIYEWYKLIKWIKDNA